MKPNPFFRRALGVCLLLLGLPVLALADAAGRFQFVSGEVLVLRSGGESRPATKGGEVFEGETIRSAANAQAQLLMADQAVIALRPESTLTIETYRYNGRSDGSERSFLGLLKGGFRALTGAIGSIYRENYRVRTPNATIGIRGTDHEPFYIPEPVPGEEPIGAPGTYDKVNAGATVLQSEGGSVELGPNQVGFVANALGAVPTLLPELPAFMRAGQGARAAERERAGAAAREKARQPAVQEKEPQPERQPAAQENRPALPTPVPRPISENFDPRNPNATTVLAPLGYAVAGGDVGDVVRAGSGAAVAGDSSATVILLDEKGMLRAIKQGDFAYAVSGARVSGGGMEVDGVPVRWGIYEGGTISDSAGVRHPKYFHFVGAPGATSTAHLAEALPRQGMSLTMKSVDGNPPMTESGAIGGKISLAVGLSNIAGRPMVDRYDLNVTDAESRSWGATLGGPLSLEDFRNGGVENLRVNCNGCPVAAGAGRAHGVVVGNPAPVGMVTSFDLNAGRAAVSGSVFAK